MPEAVFAIPGDLATPTGGYAWDRRVMALLPRFGIAVEHLRLPGSFPDPTGEDLWEAGCRLRAVPRHAVLVVDGLAFGALPEDLVASLGAPVVALVHHPLAHETGLSDVRRAVLAASETAALAHARAVVATSRFTAGLLAAEYGVSPEKITVAEPGTDPAPRAAGTGDPVRLLAVGAVSPRKGYDVLVRALSSLRSEAWHLTIVGSLDRAGATAADLAALIEREGLAERIRLAGALDDAALAAAWNAADLFVHPAWFEGYGMVLTEAMVRGLPIVSTTGGAAAATVPDDAGLKVPPGDVAALAEALGTLVRDAGRRARLADAAFAAGRSLPSWEDTAAQMAKTIGAVAP